MVNEASGSRASPRSRSLASPLATDEPVAIIDIGSNSAPKMAPGSDASRPSLLPPLA
jgi:hypothetical protein